MKPGFMRKAFSLGEKLFQFSGKAKKQIEK
jgi:hypothetical protein